MDRIKERQQKFKRGKERMLIKAQESGEGPGVVQPPEEEEDDGTMRAAAMAPLATTIYWTVVFLNGIRGSEVAGAGVDRGNCW